MKRTVLVAAVAAVAAAAVALLGGVLRSEPVANAAPADARAAALRGYAALDQARVNVDPSKYAVAERELREAVRLGGADALAYRGLAGLAAARHRFDESLRHAERARRLNPTAAAVYGLIGDANVELGRYAAGFAAFDRMASLKPGPTAYARISYGRELRGDTAGAIEAMRLAADSARPGEPRAWTIAQVANLYAGTGRTAEARALYRQILRRLPRYAPAYGGLAGIATDPERAARLYRRALSLQPSPDHAVGLADALAQLGRAAASEQYLRHAHELEAEFARFGGRNEVETALLDLDHDRNLRRALRRAREGARLRPSVEGEHALAWALYKNGRCAEARRHSIRALRIGVKDTGAIYHRHLIERCLGNRAAAEHSLRRVRSIDPGFLKAPPSAFRLRPTIAAWPRSSSGS
jgi:tetratricopeptide (TPR) repeat protein